jgi:SHS2 domain-containing protein
MASISGESSTPIPDEFPTLPSASVPEAPSDRSAYFGHDADIGVIGRGPTMEAAFIAAAEAMFAVMVDLATVQPRTAVDIAFDEPDAEFALITWLNDLLARARINRLALGRFDLTRAGDHWQGRAYGDVWRPDVDRGVEVKGATMTELSVKSGPGGWEARCVVDV